MLGKLMKHQTKAVARILLIIHAAVLILAVLGGIFTSIFSQDTLGTNILIGFLLLIYILTLVFAFFATHFIMISRFYKSMFTTEGYLTHTLPVKPWQLLLSNTVTYLIVSILNLLILVSSLLIWIRPIGLGAELMDVISAFADMFGMSAPVLLLVICGYMLLSLLYLIGMFYASLSIGNLFAPHRLVASVITYIVLYVVTQVVSLILLLVSPWMDTLSSIEPTVSVTTQTQIVTQGEIAAQDLMAAREAFEPMISYFSWMMVASAILIAVLTIIYYVVTHYILSKKLNL
ncbi:MAG: hypothetical protein EOM40_17445 [Clostridia bacterium]|nr:hypothetical protein [Clostridia bacterium]NCC43724.1 hypothetical protein [Clostridia bacterium]